MKAKGAAVAKSLEVLVNEDKETKKRQRISELMDNLNDNEELVEKVHAAVSKGFFVPGAMETKSEFEDKVVTLGRLPKTFFRDFVAELSEDFNLHRLRAIQKASGSNILLEILQYICSVSLTSYVGPRNMEEWKQVFRQRYIDKGERLTTIVTTAAHKLDWTRCGHYCLLPAMPAGAMDPAQHTFKQLKCHSLVVDLPRHVMVCGDWHISGNFALSGAFVEAPDGFFKFRAADLFKNNSQWHDLASDAWLVKFDNRDKKKQAKRKLDAESNDGEDDEGEGEHPEPIQDLTQPLVATPAKVKPEPPRETPTKLLKLNAALANLSGDKEEATTS